MRKLQHYFHAHTVSLNISGLMYACFLFNFVNYSHMVVIEQMTF